MTVEQVETALAGIEAQAYDAEAAHGLEDQLHLDVLGAIAGGIENPAALASAALRTTAISFPRHCA